MVTLAFDGAAPVPATVAASSVEGGSESVPLGTASGGPDIAKDKCPPDPVGDGRSLDSVRGNECDIFCGVHDLQVGGDLESLVAKDEKRDDLAIAFDPPSYNSICNNNSSATFPISNTVDPIPVPVSNPASHFPILASSSPVSSIDSLSLSSHSLESCSSVSTSSSDDELLHTVFAQSSKVVTGTITDNFEDDSWTGVAVETEDEKIMVVTGRDLEKGDLRDKVLRLLEAADEAFSCDMVVICLEKRLPGISELIHSLMYVGGSILPPNHPKFPSQSDYVLIGLEL
ncbi:hypothetical protein BT69DRAFT_1334732 [Atractiella rhizophila]|nr:hypothetical protein BT69DRAFT_1334732 [Atractiella rhizophila]